MKSWVSSAFSDAPKDENPVKKHNASSAKSLKIPKSSLDSALSSFKTTEKYSSAYKTFLPLCEKYKPKNRAELIVNKAKIDQLSQILDNVINKKKGSTIIIEGPSGCGKNVNIFFY